MYNNHTCFQKNDTITKKYSSLVLVIAAGLIIQNVLGQNSKPVDYNINIYDNYNRVILQPCRMQWK